MLRAIPSTSNVCFLDCLIVTHGANGRAVGPLKNCWAENLGLQPRLGKRKPVGPKTMNRFNIVDVLVTSDKHLGAPCHHGQGCCIVDNTFNFHDRGDV
jgi:hypothetical protein